MLPRHVSSGALLQACLNLSDVLIYNIQKSGKFSRTSFNRQERRDASEKRGVVAASPDQTFHNFRGLKIRTLLDVDLGIILGSSGYRTTCIRFERGRKISANLWNVERKSIFSHSIFFGYDKPKANVKELKLLVVMYEYIPPGTVDTKTMRLLKI